VDLPGVNPDCWGLFFQSGAVQYALAAHEQKPFLGPTEE